MDRDVTGTLNVAAPAPSTPFASLRAAVALLTRVPVRNSSGLTGAAAFGLVGAGVGLTAAVPVVIVGERAPIVAGGLAVAAIAVLTGVLHLDGLADTADALAAPTPEAAERARKDPHVGAAGLVAIVLAIAIDVGLIAALVDRMSPVGAAAAVLVAASVSRAVVPVVVIVVGVETRAALQGFGDWFVAGTRRRDAALSVLTVVAVSAALTLLLGDPALTAACAVGLGAGIVAGRFLAAGRGRLDGDAFGAVVEVTFAAALLVTLIWPG